MCTKCLPKVLSLESIIINSYKNFGIKLDIKYGSDWSAALDSVVDWCNKKQVAFSRKNPDSRYTT